MDWTLAIARNRAALQAIVATLFAMLEEAGGALRDRLPRSLYAAVLRLLRPAESATRRLVVIAARGLVVKPAPARPMPAGLVHGAGRRQPAFRLFDPRKRFALREPRTPAHCVPRLHVFAHDPRVAALWLAPQPLAGLEPAALIDARPLGRRLQALRLALADLPRQARRLARWRARRDKRPGVTFISPLRPGRPPGHRRNPLHEVDRVLAECHGLARDALAPDTS